VLLQRTLQSGGGEERGVRLLYVVGLLRALGDHGSSLLNPLLHCLGAGGGDLHVCLPVRHLRVKEDRLGHVHISDKELLTKTRKAS
jgi:hypothetical protein